MGNELKEFEEILSDFKQAKLFNVRGRAFRLFLEIFREVKFVIKPVKLSGRYDSSFSDRFTTRRRSKEQN